MTRQDAFAQLKKEAQEPIALIPLAQGTRRANRDWDRAHPVIAYRISAELHDHAREIRSAILGLAHQHMTSISNVGSALAGYSLAHVRQGKLVIFPRPNASRRKMTLFWEEANDWPKEIPIGTRTSGKKTKDLFLGFRWERDVDQQIKALAGREISSGEVVVFLLKYALDAYRSGRLRLKEEAVVVSQKVTATW